MILEDLINPATTQEALKFHLYNESSTTDLQASMLYEFEFPLDQIVNNTSVPGITMGEKVMHFLKGSKLDFNLRVFCKGKERPAYKLIMFLDNNCNPCVDCNDPSVCNYTSMRPILDMDGSMIINCPGCLIPGANVYGKSVYRADADRGLVDSNNDGMPDGGLVDRTAASSAYATTGDRMTFNFNMGMSDGESGLMEDVKQPDNSFISRLAGVSKADLASAQIYLNNAYLTLGVGDASKYTVKEIRATYKGKTITINGNSGRVKTIGTTQLQVRIPVCEFNDPGVACPYDASYDGSMIDFSVDVEIGDLGRIASAPEVLLNGGYSACDDCDEYAFSGCSTCPNKFIYPAGKLSRGVQNWREVPNDYITIAEIKANENVYFFCTMGSSVFKYIPYFQYSQLTVKDSKECDKSIKVKTEGKFIDKEIAGEIEAFDKEYRSFVAGEDILFEVPILKGYKVKQLKIVNFYASSPFQFRQIYTINDPLVNNGSSNNSVAHYSESNRISGDNLSHPQDYDKLALVRLKYEDVSHHLSVSPAYYWNGYQDFRDYYTDWPGAGNSLPLILMDERFSLEVEVVITPDVSCLEILDINVRMDGDNGNHNKPIKPLIAESNFKGTSSTATYESYANSTDPIIINPNIALGTVADKLAKFAYDGSQIITAPKAKLDIQSITETNFDIIEGTFDFKIKVTNVAAIDGGFYKVDYPFLKISSPALQPANGLVLEGVFLTNSLYEVQTNSTPFTYQIDNDNGTYLVGIGNDPLNTNTLQVPGSFPNTAGSYYYVLRFSYTSPSDCNIQQICDNSQTYVPCLNNAPLIIEAGYNCSAYPDFSNLDDVCSVMEEEQPFTMTNTSAGLKTEVYLDNSQDPLITDANIAREPCTNGTYTYRIQSCKEGFVNNFETIFNFSSLGITPSLTAVRVKKGAASVATYSPGVYSELTIVNTGEVYSVNFTADGLKNGDYLEYVFTASVPCIVPQGLLSCSTEAVSYAGPPVASYVTNQVVGQTPTSITLDNITVDPIEITSSIGLLQVKYHVNGAATQYPNEISVKVSKGSFVETYTCVIPAGKPVGMYSFYKDCNSASLTLPSDCDNEYNVQVFVKKGFEASCAQGGNCTNMLPQQLAAEKNLIVPGSFYIPTITFDGKGSVIIPVCHPTVTLKAEDGYQSYEWFKSTASGGPYTSLGLPSDLNKSITVSEAGFYHVRASNGTCSGISNNLEVIDEFYVSGDDKICPGETSNMNTTIKGVIGTYLMQWFKDNTDLHTGPRTAGSYYALITLTDFAEPCTLRTANTFLVEQLPVPVPMIVNEPTDHFMCPGDPAITITAQPKDPSVVNFSWNTGESDVQSITVTQGGQYSITGIGANGCSSISNSVTIVSPHLEVFQECIDNTTTKLTATINGSGGDFVWKDISNTILPADNTIANVSSIVVTSDGTYTVTAKALGCPLIATPKVCRNISTAGVGDNLAVGGDFSTLNSSCSSLPFMTEFYDCTTTNLSMAEWPGSFIITNNAASYNNGRWQGGGMPSSNGNFLLVDGKVTAKDEKIWYQNVQVEECADYNFVAYVRNVLNPSIVANPSELPKVYLTIKGIKTGRAITFTNQPWIKLEGRWKCNVPDQQVEIAVNLEKGGWVGRDIGIDEIAFAKYTCDQDPVTPLPCNLKVNAGGIKKICPSTTATIGEDITLPAGVTFSWSMNTSGTPPTTLYAVVSPSVETTYTLTLTDGPNCSVKDEVTVEVLPAAAPANAGPDKAICNGQSVQLDATNNEFKYSWSPSTGLSSSTIFNPIASPTTETTYTLTTRNTYGCMSEDQVTVTVNNCVPNTQINSNCNKAHSITSGSMSCTPVLNANQYEFRFTPVGGGQVVTRLQPGYSLGIANISNPGLQWGTTYIVDVRARIGTQWGNFSTACSIQTVPDPSLYGVPATQINQCNQTFSPTSGNTTCVIVGGASSYEFRLRLTDGTLVATRPQSSNTLAFANITPQLNWSTTYIVDVRATIGGVQGSYGTACQIHMVPDPANGVPVTQINQCNQTLSPTSGSITCGVVAGASSYEFRLRLADGTVVATRSQSNITLAFANITQLNWGTSYTVDVRATVGGVQGNYGTACQIHIVSDPINGVAVTRITASQCNLQYSPTSGSIGCAVVAGAAYYEFKISYPDGTIYAMRQQGSITLQLANVTPLLEWGTTYKVEVRVRIGTIDGNYGDPCTISTVPDPSIHGVPLTRLRTNNCNLTYSPTTGTVACSTVTGASTYEYRLTHSNGTVITKERIGSLGFNTLTPTLNYGTSYAVDVRAKIGDVWGSYGPACLIHTSPAPRQPFNQIQDTMLVEVYPNPTSGEFTLLIGGKEEETVKMDILNMNGTVIYTDTHYPKGIRQTVREPLRSGIYQLRIFDRDRVKILKLVVTE